MHRSEIISSIVLSSHALARIAAQESRDDAPAAQWRVLSLLEREGPMRVGALASAARTTQPGMTRLIGDLEAAGLVSRGTDPLDSRATVVHVLPDGTAAMRRWRLRFKETLEPRFRDLDDDDWSTLERAAHLLADHANESDDTEARA